MFIKRNILGKQMGRINNYKYLGSWVNENKDQSREIRTRIEIVSETFVKKKKMLINRDLSVALGMRALKRYVFFILYRMESWTLKIEHITTAEAL